MSGELFPHDSTERKGYPIYSGLLQYFPSALAAVAHHSFISNEKHNPGQSLHHDRAKSGDEADAMVRHLMERDYVGMAWRALALLQKHLESQGAPIAPGARNANKAAQTATPKQIVAELAREAQTMGLYDDGIPAESAYIASLRPDGSRIATADEVANLRDFLTAERLREYGIGDVLPADHPWKHITLHGPESHL